MTTPDALMTAYANWMRAWDASDNTIKARTSVLGPKVTEWGGPQGVTRENVEAWLGSPDIKSPWTRSTYYSHLKSLCDWLVASGQIDTNPMLSVRAPRRKAGVPKPLSENEAERVMAVATGDVRAWLVLAMDVGLRAHEIAKLRGEDVTPEYVYVRGKGDVEVFLPTHPNVWELAQSYPRTGWWFPADGGAGPIPRERISKYVGDFFRANGIPHGSIHRCRHLYATRLLRRGVNIRVVQKLMRHSRVETTSGYTAVDEDELRNAILRLPNNAA